MAAGTRIQTRNAPGLASVRYAADTHGRTL